MSVDSRSSSAEQAYQAALRAWALGHETEKQAWLQQAMQLGSGDAFCLYASEHKESPGPIGPVATDAYRQAMKLGALCGFVPFVDGDRLGMPLAATDQLHGEKEEQTRQAFQDRLQTLVKAGNRRAMLLGYSWSAHRSEAYQYLRAAMAQGSGSATYLYAQEITTGQTGWYWSDANRQRAAQALYARAFASGLVDAAREAAHQSLLLDDYAGMENWLERGAAAGSAIAMHDQIEWLAGVKIATETDEETPHYTFVADPDIRHHVAANPARALFYAQILIQQRPDQYRKAYYLQLADYLASQLSPKERTEVQSKSSQWMHQHEVTDSLVGFE